MGEVPISAPSTLLPVPACGFLNKSAKDGPRARVVIKGPLGVPLHGENKVPGLGALERFDDLILWTSRHDPEAVANGVGCLVVTGISRDQQARGRISTACLGLRVSLGAIPGANNLC